MKKSKSCCLCSVRGGTCGSEHCVGSVTRQDWEENGVEHLRISLGNEKSTAKPNVKKSKKRKAVNWAAELTTFGFVRSKNVLRTNSCVYVHDTVDEERFSMGHFDVLFNHVRKLRLRHGTWCSSAKRENFNHFTFSCFLLRHKLEECTRI